MAGEVAFRLDELDPEGMGAQIASLPRQLEEGSALAEALSSLPSRRGLRQVVVVGMGGSAIGGDLLGSYLAPQLRLPLLVERGPRLPAYLGGDSLVVAISYSGETEETLVAFGEALRRGARSLAVASGGRLLRRARKWGVPALALPGGASSRAALGHLFSSVLTALSRMGLLPPQRGPLEEAARALRAGNAELCPDASPRRNRALALARRLRGRVPVVYGTHRGTDAAARRWRCQFHENAKSWAAEGVLPEMNHNEVVGWAGPGELLRGGCFAIFLVDPREPPPLRRRVAATRSLLRGSMAGSAEVVARGRGRLARLLSLVQMGDWTSYYLALLNGVNPTPIPAVDRLKAILAPRSPR